MTGRNGASGGQLLVLLVQQGGYTLLLRTGRRLHGYKLCLLRLQLKICICDQLLRFLKLTQLLPVVFGDLCDVFGFIQEVRPALCIQNHVDEAGIPLLIHKADTELHAGILIRFGLGSLRKLPLRELDVELLLRDGGIELIYFIRERGHALIECLYVACSVGLLALKSADGILNLGLLLLQRIDGCLIRINGFLCRIDRLFFALGGKIWHGRTVQ